MTDNSTSAIPEVDRESLIKQHLPLVGARVIDVGCGEGWLTQLVGPETDSIIGIDPSEASIGRARAAKKSSNETYLPASADSLPVDDSWADIVVVDETRETVLSGVGDILRERFDHLGVTVEGGRSYDQAHRLNLLRRL